VTAPVTDVFIHLTDVPAVQFADFKIYKNDTRDPAVVEDHVDRVDLLVNFNRHLPAQYSEILTQLL
jgi:hypothetical protein